MTKYLLDTNAYFAILKYIVDNEKKENFETVIGGECYISKLTQIEIISVIGKYARGQIRHTQVCDRVHEKSGVLCGERYIVEQRKKWSGKKLHDWLKLEREISNGTNSIINVKVLEVTEAVVKEAEIFIQNALVHNFKSMDAMILGTAKAYSTSDSKIIIVTADKGLKAGMEKIAYPFVSLC